MDPQWFNGEPDPYFHLKADPDPESPPNADQDPGQTLPSKRVEFTLKIYLRRYRFFGKAGN